MHKTQPLAVENCATGPKDSAGRTLPCHHRENWANLDETIKPADRWLLTKNARLDPLDQLNLSERLSRPSLSVSLSYMFLLQTHVLNLDLVSLKMGCLPSKFSDYRYPVEKANPDGK